MRFLRLPAAAVLILVLGSCRGDPFDPLAYNTSWTVESHGQTAPNYSVVLPQDSVNRIDIYLTAAEWMSIRQEMVTLWGFDFGAKNRPCCGPYPSTDPSYVDARVEFKGKVWKHVGFRLKGNQSLHYAWNDGSYKLPFRLKFDAFEDEHGETWNQRFYGFKDLSASSNLYDYSQIRERVATDLFRLAGVPAPHTSSYRVYIDFGAGLTYNGVYTMIELPDDTMIQDQFGESSGNIYKPESKLNTFIAAEFPRQNNDASTDYSDVQALITAVNNTALEKSNPAQWRANLEAVFNVDEFLKWLAANNAMAAWDTYGYIAHNFYLYNHSTKRLTWIPWDQNLTFNNDPEIIEPTPRVNSALSLSMGEVEATWPLLRNVADDPVYFARYKANLKSFSNDVFTQARTDSLITKYMDMVGPYTIGPNGELPGHTLYVDINEFPAARGYLQALIASRRAKIAQFVP